MYKFTVIIPTLNEAENIRQSVKRVFEVLDEKRLFGQVFVVDDNSTDGTIDILKDLWTNYPDFDFYVRKQDHGLSQSVIEGFGKAGADVFIVMDADGEHPIEKIPELYREICNDNDIVIGSRYMDGGGIEKWGYARRIISIGATLIARLFFPEITDPGSGFFAIKKSVIEGAMLHPRGYKLLVEILGKGNYDRVKEIPILFGVRKKGDSKLKGHTVMEYLRQLSELFWFSIHLRDSHAYIEFSLLAKFMIVGLTGIIVNMGFLYCLTEKVGLFYLISSLIAIELSIISNFCLNNAWTFRDVDNLHSWFGRAVRFHAVSISGILINFVTLFVLTSVFGFYYLLSNLIGILLAFAWNFTVNLRWTWTQV